MNKLFLFILLIFSQISFSENIEEKISQMLIFGFQGEGINSSEFSDIKQALYENKIGGLIFFRRNIENEKQIKRFISDIKNIEKDYPLFISIDQEGGFVQRISSDNGFFNTKSAFDISKLSKEEAKKDYDYLSLKLKELDFNLNFGPVVDLNINSDSPAIGKYERSYSKDPVTVLKYSEIFIKSHHDAGVLTCLKHFPGHGSANEDSHLQFTDISSTWSKKELIPYSALINNGYNDLIMTGHLFNENIDDKAPATLSYKYNQMLRDELKYKGVTISDDLLMSALYDNYSLEEIVINAIKAGNNILLFSSSYKNDLYLIDRVRKIITNALKDGNLDESYINESYNKIINLKKRIGGNYEH